MQLAEYSIASASVESRGTMPSLCAINSSARTEVFSSISTRSIAIVGTSEYITRRSELAKARSTLERTKFMVRASRSTFWMATAGPRSSSTPAKSIFAMCFVRLIWFKEGGVRLVLKRV